MTIKINRSRGGLFVAACLFTAGFPVLEGEGAPEPDPSARPAPVIDSEAPSPSNLSTYANPEETIEALLAKVAASKVIFIRNGKEYPGAKAVSHMQKKYRHFKKEIDTPEDFIRLCGTQSLRSGKVYQVRLKDGKVMPCAQWLTNQLKIMRDGNGAAHPAPAGPGSP